jgi:hypothetical protein
LNINNLAKELFNIFASDQRYYLKQLEDGTYRKMSGQTSVLLIEKKILEKDSLAIYQKNLDSSVKWICYDFDILKKHLNKETFVNASEELSKTILNFTNFLNEHNISYLTEFSGNRGIHIWITFEDSINYQVAYNILNIILIKSKIEYNKDLIDIDLFPKSSSPSDGIGHGVKMPLSKHKKSNKYSYFLKSFKNLDNLNEIEELNSEFIENQLSILKSHKDIDIAELENELNVFIDLNMINELEYKYRVHSIKIKNDFDTEILFTHWEKHEPLKFLVTKIRDEKEIGISLRLLLVGLLANLLSDNNEKFSREIIHSVFKFSENYNFQKTENAIEKLSSFFFPTQEQIESITRKKFKKKYTINELINVCIPEYIEHKDATFEISKKDIFVTAIAELNYLFLNDEVQVKHIINNLASIDSEKIINRINNFDYKKINYYKHIRNEDKQERKLYSLDVLERVLTSSLIKNIDFFLNFIPNVNSYGYKLNRNFKGGYIYEHWLYLWIKFLSNLSSVLNDPFNQEYYVLKTDIKNFYNLIPHDNIKRMFLSDGNNYINKRIKDLESNSFEKYQSSIELLMNITEIIVEDNKGLPQGPAYARYIAEIYLNDLDNYFDNKLKDNDILLYQRYVDDIFIVVKNEDDANNVKAKLSIDLEILGLSINEEKTKIRQIKNFTDDFNKYRAQSKYAIDRISKDYDNATNHEKELAISEFAKLFESDSCKDDLSFIFSHLPGIKFLDEMKKNLVIETLNNKIGRGSLYKHIFNFILDNEEYWYLLNDVDKLDILQSEVFTSTLINVLESSKLKIEKVLSLLEDNMSILSSSETVDEHIAYIHLNFKLNIDITSLSKKCILKALMINKNNDNLNISSKLITHINSELNSISSLYDFIQTIYPICITKNISKNDINNISGIFYAKISSDYENNIFSKSVSNPILNTESIVKKFYYLICLFSLSKSNSSIELINSVWEYCIYCFNRINILDNSYLYHDWIKLIDKIDIDEKKATHFIVSLIEGSPFRGELDNNKLFIKFNNTLIIYVVFNKKISDKSKIVEKLNEVKDKSEFYNWIIDNDNVSLFPNNKAWFEKNISLNNTVLLRKENQILIQKPIKDFISEKIKETQKGYGELVVDYEIDSLSSLREIIKKESILNTLKLLIESIDDNQNKFSNIFIDEKILSANSLEPFTYELSEQNTLIFQNFDNSVSTYENKINNYIILYLNILNEGKNSSFFKLLNEKYIQNLDKKICLLKFIKQLYILLSDFDDTIYDFYCDILVSNIIYSLIEETNINRKIEIFVNQYNKFGKNIENKYIFTVNQKTSIDDNSLFEFFNSINSSLSILNSEVLPTNILFLNDDIIKIKDKISKIANSILEKYPEIEINDFKKASIHRLNILSSELIVDMKTYKFDNIKLFNVQFSILEALNENHSVLISSAEHMYYKEYNGELFIVAIPSSISKIFESIKKRYEIFIIGKGETTTYPTGYFDNQKFSSIPKYSIALENVMVNQDIGEKLATKYLNSWLRTLSKSYHKILISLISAHVTMKNEDINKFVNKYHELVLDRDNMNPFLIKKNNDNNGTHRILNSKCKEGKNTRIFDDLGPSEIKNGAQQATIIVDNIISGTQIINAIKHYLGIKTKDGAYFEFKQEDRSKLLNLEQINICTVLYTTKGIEFIKKECEAIFKRQIKISVISGYDIKDDSTFSTSSRLTPKEKESIIKFLQDEDSMNNMFSHLNYVGLIKDEIKYWNEKKHILNTNLVTRYKSLPKNGFSFLYYDLKNITEHKPFIRVLEKNE